MYTIGSDTNTPKFGLNGFREILEKSSKYLQKFSKYLPKFSKYLKISWKFRILIRWRTLVSKPQRRQRLSRHSIWWSQYHSNALAGKKLIIDAKCVTHWWLIFKNKWQKCKCSSLGRQNFWNSVQITKKCPNYLETAIFFLNISKGSKYPKKYRDICIWAYYTNTRECVP